MESYKLGIDLSTTITGYCLMQGTKVIRLGTINLLPWCEKNIEYNLELFDKVLSPIFNNYGIIKVGIELSNFSNPQLTGRFNFYAGCISTLYYMRYNEETPPLPIKTFTSNEWQSLIGCPCHEERAQRKLRAKAFYTKQTGLVTDSEDEADAYCIAYFLHELKSSEQKSEAVKNNTKKKHIEDKEIKKLSIMMNTRYKKLNDKALSPKKRAKILEEISFLSTEIEKLKGK